MVRLWPRSLAGQMALLIAAALFVAQAVNFGIAWRDRTAFRLAQATRPVATRLADALEREASGSRPLVSDRGRIRRVAANPIPPIPMTRHPELANALRLQLADLGIAAGRIETAIIPRSDEDPPRRGEIRRRGGRAASTLRIAVEQPGRGWLLVNARWPEPGPRLLIALIVQTLILYGIVLLPVLWLGRRLTRPLRELTVAARGFGRGEDTALPESGPEDVRALVAAFNGLRMRVHGMLDEKDRMLGAIGHDLRTPLAALRVRIESVEDEADRARMADTIAEMSRTLDDILSLARLGRPSEAATEVDVAALVDAVAEDFRDLGAAVTVADVERIVWTLRPALMRRAVRNLIENAVKYGGGAEVSVRRDAGGVRICVADRGPGIAADQLGNVFDPFTRLEQSRNRESGGVGLGLALARGIVREAGGEIALCNRDGGGLLAEIVLPAR